MSGLRRERGTIVRSRRYTGGICRPLKLIVRARERNLVEISCDVRLNRECPPLSAAQDGGMATSFQPWDFLHPGALDLDALRHSRV